MSGPPDKEPIPAPIVPPPDATAVRYGSRMLRTFGWFYKTLGLTRAFGRVRFEEHSAERIRRAHAAGPIVYVLLRRSALDHLALNSALNRHELPLSQWADRITSFYWQPVMKAYRELYQRWSSWMREGRPSDPVRSGWLAEAISQGRPVVLFLGPHEEDRPDEEDPLTAVLDAATRLGCNVQLLPVICVWDRAPEHDSDTVRNFLLGSRENPGLFSTLSNLYMPSGQGPFVQVGEPVDTAELVRRVPEDRRLRSLRTVLRRFLKRESSVVRGPRLKPRAALQQLVLDNPPMRTFAKEEAARSGRSVAAVQRAMAKEFDTIAASFSWAVIRAASIVMRPLWNRVFSGYDIRDEDLERIRTAKRNGTAVLVPCHKSHFDYLLLSWVLYHDDLIVPHVVAGINLAIWPVHYFLRGAGGFFIRRSFDGEHVHAAVFSRYLRELLRQGYTVEFFIEGGRTRTGKLLRARLGVLEMILDSASMMPPDREITLLPIAIAYEQVAEQSSYTSELRGGEKQAESMSQLFRARQVLRRRFGRIYLRVGEPIVASEVIAATTPAYEELDEDQRRDRLRVIGDRLMASIGDVMVVLPTGLVALALLAHHRQAITHAELMVRIARFRTHLDRIGALSSDLLTRPDGAIKQALDRFTREGRIRELRAGDERIWHVVPDQREALDFHKNQILQFFAVPSLVAASIRVVEGRVFDAATLCPTFERVVTLLQREFTFPPEMSTEALLASGLADLVAHGAIATEGDGFVVSDAERIGEILGLTRSLLEAYQLVATETARMAGKPMDAKQTTKALQEQGESWLEAGLLSRPESLASVTLRNAVSAMVDEGRITRHPDRVEPHPEALAEVSDLLASMVQG